MWKSVLFIGCMVHASGVVGQWTCSSDAQCADVAGAVCVGGACTCPSGQQALAQQCVNLAPYHTSPCVEDHQCSRLFGSFECRKTGDAQEGECRCREGNHYFLGRCWRSMGYGADCSQDEECIDVPRNPFSLRCDSTCVCAYGYYERQRGECRKIAYAVGDACVIDEDCQFTDGVCSHDTMTCLGDVTRITPPPVVWTANMSSSVDTTVSSRSHGASCANVACEAPFECSTLGVCACPLGYYVGGDGNTCLAELGSVSTAEQCVGFIAEVVDGVCTCPANFFFEDDMRHCVKVSRTIEESCIIDANCHTFGSAGRCNTELAWGMRACGCDADHSVWDSDRQMCRLFAGVGERCEADSDCLAGELEIQCEVDAAGLGYCTCPEHSQEWNGLCVTTGLGLGDECQVSLECTETANTACVSGQCACAEGYLQQGEDFCAPIIGGTCEQDDDCMIEHTVCHNDTNVLTCQCNVTHVAHLDLCWPVSEGFASPCNNSAQCEASLGANGLCDTGRCACDAGHHHRDEGCWPLTGLFEPCARTSQCYLQTMSERVVCRNSLCQCDFSYPFSELEHTCLSSSAFSFYADIVTWLPVLVSLRWINY